jgi:hypothetical protein
MPDADFTRWVSPRALAEVIAFLVSDAARAISGAALPVAGRVSTRSQEFNERWNKTARSKVFLCRTVTCPGDEYVG